MASGNINPALRAYLNSCTHAVAVRFLGAWSVVSWCRGRSEALVCLQRWRNRSNWQHKVIKFKEKPMNNEIDKSKADNFHEIRGQALAKRAVEVALAGNHQLLLAVTEYGKSREFSDAKIQATETAENSYCFRQAEAMAVASNITPKSEKQFMALSKPKRSDLLLRSEMVVEVPAMPLDEMQRPPGEPFDQIWARVERARAVLAKTAEKSERLRYDLDSAGTRLLRQAKESLDLPAIRVEQILCVSLTVAALDGGDEIKPHHLAEAIQYGRTFLAP